MSSKTELAKEYAKLVLDAHSSGIEKYSNLLHKSETKKEDIILTQLQTLFHRS